MQWRRKQGGANCNGWYSKSHHYHGMRKSIINGTSMTIVFIQDYSSSFLQSTRPEDQTFSPNQCGIFSVRNLVSNKIFNDWTNFSIDYGWKVPGQPWSLEHRSESRGDSEYKDKLQPMFFDFLRCVHFEKSHGSWESRPRRTKRAMSMKSWTGQRQPIPWRFSRSSNCYGSAANSRRWSSLPFHGLKMKKMLLLMVQHAIKFGSGIVQNWRLAYIPQLNVCFSGFGRDPTPERRSFLRELWQKHQLCWISKDPFAEFVKLKLQDTMGCVLIYVAWHRLRCPNSITRS